MKAVVVFITSFQSVEYRRGLFVPRVSEPSLIRGAFLSLIFRACFSIEDNGDLGPSRYLQRLILDIASWKRMILKCGIPVIECRMLFLVQLGSLKESLRRLLRAESHFERWGEPLVVLLKENFEKGLIIPNRLPLTVERIKFVTLEAVDCLSLRTQLSLWAIASYFSFL